MIEEYATYAVGKITVDHYYPLSDRTLKDTVSHMRGIMEQLDVYYELSQILMLAHY